MSPSNRKSSLNRDTTSCIRNKNRKRSFIRSTENDNDIYYKRKKSIKHSQVDINNAVLTSPNGYMTRNKLNKHLTSNSELVETNVIEDKCSRINNISNKSETANKKTKSSNKIHNKMLELGFVFTDDILSQYHGKQVDTKYKKSIPSLFESDSDPEIDYLRIKDGIKNEVKELSTCISYPDDICPAFDKNVEMRTYFNKKSYPINNRSNIKSLNIIEEINPEPTNLNNHVKTVNDSNLCKSISQNYSKIKKSSKVTADSTSLSNSKSVSFEPCDQNYINFNKNEISPTTNECIQSNTEDDDIIIVTESFIRQLKNEFEMIKTESQSIENRTQELFHDSIIIKSNNSDIEQPKDNKVVSKMLSSDFEVNQINVLNVDDICDVNSKSSIYSNLSLKQDVGVIDESHKFISSSSSPSKTTNNVENSLMSIFDEPKENILVESYANIKNNLIIESDSDSSTTISEEVIGLSSLQTFEFNYSNSDQYIENHLKSEKNIACQLSPDLIEPNQYFHSAIKDEIDIKIESFNNKGNSNCLIKTDNLSSTNKGYSKNYNNFYSKCYCKNFISFNNNDNKIITSKIKHFAFNDNANKVRQIKLHKKHLEANILNTLITKEHINIIQSREHNTPIFNSTLIGKKYEKSIDLKENDHIEPSILSMLKDVYVDVEYLTEYCDYNTSDHKLSEPQNNNKDKNVAILNNTSQSQSINLKADDGQYDNFINKKTIDNFSISNTTTEKPINSKPCDGSYFNFGKINTIDNFSISNTTTTEKPINIKPCDEINVKFDKNETIDDFPTSNTTITEKPANIKPCDGSYVNFNKNNIIYNFPAANTRAIENPVNIKPCDKINVNFDKNETIYNFPTSNTTTIEKPVNIKPCDEINVKFDKNETIDNFSISNTTITEKSANIKPCDGSNVNFNKNNIIYNFPTSNTTTIEKPVNIKPCDEINVKFDKNETIDDFPTSNTTITETPANIKPCDGSYVDHSYTSNNTMKNKPINIESLEENCVNFNKNIIFDNIPTSTSKLVNFEHCDHNYINCNQNETDSPRINIIKKDDFDCDSACNSHVINSEIDTESKIKVEDDFNYDTTAIKYDFKSDKNPELDICHLSNSTMIINKNNDSKEELEMLVKCNNIESENILSSVKINTNHRLTQSKVSHILKDEHIPVPAIIDNENETNKSTYFEPPQFKNVFDTSDTISLNEYQFFPTLPHISENNAPVNKLFDLPADDIVFSLNNISSDDDDDDDRLLIEDIEPNIDGNINKNSTCILKSADSSKNERTINCISSAASIKRFKFCEKKLISPKKQSSEINLIKNEEVSNPILPRKKCVISNNNFEVTHLLEDKKNFLDDCMSYEMCNELRKIKSSHKSIVNKNESLPKYIQDILKEMYVDELFVSTCQHMVDLYDDDDQSKSDVFFQTNKCKKIPYEKLVCDINTNVEKITYSEYNQSVSTKVETLWKTEINYETQENNKLSNLLTKENNSVSLRKPNDVKTKYPELRQSISTKEETILTSEIIERKQQKNPINPTNTTQKSKSLQKPKNFKSNMKIRIHLREFILSNKPLDKILESKEFRNLRFFSEEEIASSICVFIFEKSIDTPIITGLSVYRVNYDQLNIEEKNKILTSTNLNITFPKILMLTSITLALAKMLRSDTLIEVILNCIRRSVLAKKINTDHTIDDQLIKQVVYFVDICVRLRRLKTLQIFIFDSMVFLPNKYCCIIFISLLLWKNCLPRSISTKEDPVIITVMSFLIAKKKLYSEQTVGCDIFQRELINLLSCHFNYTFSIDIPTNFIQHIHKPDFFVSVVMFLKCCDPKDLVEFMVNSLFPIIDNYLNTQRNEMHAIQTMESINMAIQPFKITYSTTVNTYLKKCKDPINGFKKNGKEHIYITAYNSHKILQNKFIEYLNDNRPRSQFFEESLMTIILVLGSADYLTSCMSLIQWKPKFELSAILSKKIVIFKSIIGDNILWDKLCAIDDIDRLKCVVNSCLLNKDVYNTIIQLHNLR